MAEIEIKKIDSMVRSEVPEDGADVFSDFFLSHDEIDRIKKNLTALKIYKREKEECPFNRGNWVCDQFYGENIFCIKLPIGMKEKDVLKYFKPLIDLMKSGMN